MLAEPPSYDVASYPSIGLDRSQIGHLRHFANLSRQAPNQWDLMKGKGYGQEDFGGYRFQLAYMAYALGLTYRHRLPAAPGLFKPIFERLIEKMLLPEVWMYWRDVSRGGSIFNAHLSSQYQEEWDPIARDNIMYSAYLQSMSLMYHYLFNDARYAQPGALTVRFWSYFWGGEEKRFVYDEKSLNDHLYRLMVESGYIGVACEPNCVFQICNQPAILGFRLHDLVALHIDFGRLGPAVRLAPAGVSDQ
jgi:Linalool dehydratase/isomerase